MRPGAPDTLTQFALQRWRFCVALAVGVGLLQATSEFLSGEAFERLAKPSLLWVLETPVLVFVLSLTFDRLVAWRRGPIAVLAASFCVAVALGGVMAIAFVVVVERLGLHLNHDAYAGPFPDPFGDAAFGAIGAVILAGIWGLAFVSPHLTQVAQRRRLEAQQLRFEARRLRVASELARLRSQLEPHFLLNTLNTIAGLATQRPGDARRLLEGLEALLRESLEERHETQTLEQEVAWLRRYADILESRHGDTLRFEWDIAPEALGVVLPWLLLQPLVENAVQHGALCRAGAGTVAVSARLSAVTHTLVCTVKDNGPGLKAATPRDGAVGLHTVRRRLELQYPGSSLRLHSSSEGTSAVVEIVLA